MIRKTGLFFLFAFVVLFPLCAQSAAVIEKIAASERLLKGAACYLVGTAAGLIGDKDTADNAFSQFSNLKMFKTATPDEEIRLDEFANLALQGLQIKGGLWFRAAKNPHYAFRQLKTMGIIPRNAIPSAFITPKDAAKMLNALIEIIAGEDLSKKQTAETLREE